MRPNRTRSIAKKNMRIKGLTSNRPEQKNLKAVFVERLPSRYIVETEKKFFYIKDDGIETFAKIDVVVYGGGQLAIRMMGKIHEEKKYILHDTIQKLYLEYYGWKVVDLWYDKLPNLWSLKKTHWFEGSKWEMACKESRDFLREFLPLRANKN